MVSIHTLLHATRTNHANKPGVAVEHGLTDVDNYACIDWPACGALFACMLTFGFVLCLGPAIAAMDAASVVLFVSALIAPPSSLLSLRRFAAARTHGDGALRWTACFDSRRPASCRASLDAPRKLRLHRRSVRPTVSHTAAASGSRKP